ncbi:helix-turn-helix transcriptional regulator [Brevibacillus sp. 179-C9.3 HS]|uniref:helix-turn-helix transcriptional regulator n=1 Tax=unclassified Brevibacillus TaxID=2684853 RepID=UPI0039A2C095
MNIKLRPCEKIRVWRNRQGLTQEAVAMRLQCSQMTVSRYERGAEPKTDEEKQRIESVLGVKIWSEEADANE